MVARSISLMNIVDEYNISDETILNIFYDVLRSEERFSRNAETDL